MPIGAARINGLGKSEVSAGPQFVPYSDANAAYLRLALPMNSVTGMDDVSHLVTGSPNSVPSTRSGPNNATYANIQTATSKFYGAAYRQYAGGGSTQKLTYAMQQSWFPHTTNYTVEFWINTTRTSSNSWFLSNSDVGGRYLLGLYVSGSPPSNIGTSDYRLRINSGWHHIAIQRDYWYYDGVRKGTVSEPTLSAAIANLYIGQQNTGDGNDWEGYLNDFRLYIGINKYSGTTITVPGAMGEIV